MAARRIPAVRRPTLQLPGAQIDPGVQTQHGIGAVRIGARSGARAAVGQLAGTGHRAHAPGAQIVIGTDQHTAAGAAHRRGVAVAVVVAAMTPGADPYAALLVLLGGLADSLRALQVIVDRITHVVAVVDHRGTGAGQAVAGQGRKRGPGRTGRQRQDGVVNRLAEPRAIAAPV
jgi:hypothetical protein